MRYLLTICLLLSLALSLESAFASHAPKMKKAAQKAATKSLPLKDVDTSRPYCEPTVINPATQLNTGRSERRRALPGTLPWDAPLHK
jgi:hypothetical protein